jgi:hypothetical protein
MCSKLLRVARSMPQCAPCSRRHRGRYVNAQVLADGVDSRPVAAAHRSCEIFHHRALRSQLGQPRRHGGRDRITHHVNCSLFVEPVGDLIDRRCRCYRKRPVLPRSQQDAVNHGWNERADTRKIDGSPESGSARAMFMMCSLSRPASAAQIVYKPISRSGTQARRRCDAPCARLARADPADTWSIEPAR